MSPDDSRHGTLAGHSAGCRDLCCHRAKLRYDKARKYDRHNGRPRKVSSLGSVRRLNALRALGWSMRAIADHCDLSYKQLHNVHRYPTCRVRTHEQIAAVFELLSMRLPPTSTPLERHSATKTRLHAARQGWLPPMAWDNPDDPNERPARTLAHTPKSDVDEAVVLRVMAGERLPMTTGERVEVVARLRARGWSLNEIETRCHIGKPERYLDRGAA